MHTIYAQSSISFSYNSKKINDQQKIKITERRITVYNAMASVKKNTGIKYRIIGNHIILLPGSPGNKKKPKKEPVPEETIVILSKATDPENIKELKEADVFIPTKGIVDMNIKADLSFLSQPGATSTTISDRDDKWIDPYNTLNSTREEEKAFKPGNNSKLSLKDQLLFQAGISVDEIYYLNPTLHAGFNFLYATASYNLLGKYPHFRFGIGSSLKVNDSWRLHLNISTGPAQNAGFNTIQITDSTYVDEEESWIYIYSPLTIRAKSRLDRITVGTEWKATSYLSVAAGATLNLLRTTYEAGDNKIRLSDYTLPADINPEEDYIAIKPPYVISSNFDLQRPNNTRLWIGFNFSLLYTLSLKSSR